MTYYVEQVDITKKEKDYVLPKLPEEEKLGYYTPPSFLYLTRVVVGEKELVECSYCNGTGKENIREEWYTNCKRCDDGGVPGPPGKRPKGYK